MLPFGYESISNLFSMSCICKVLALTPVWAKLSMQPESSDGFASVGTILPKEETALLPGGLFASGGEFWVRIEAVRGLFASEPVFFVC